MYKMRTSLTNSTAAEQTVVVEPWADEHALPAGETFDVVARAPQAGTLEVEVGGNRIVVWGWEGSVVNLYREGALVYGGRGERQPVPTVPRGKSVRGFLHSMLNAEDPGSR